VSGFVESTIRRDFLSGAIPNAGRNTVTIPDIVIIPNIMVPPNGGHDDDEVRLSELPSEPFILFVGALQMHKGLAPLLAAYDQLRNRPPMVLLGSVWPDTPREFPEGVTIMRNVPHPVVMKAWERSLFGVVPSIWPDPLPGTVREAMSTGKAVIASAAGGIGDMVVHGETGLLVPPGDADALRDAMEKLIADPELRQQMGEAGRERTASFAAEEVLPRFEALYRQLVGASRAR
jgi:glycosyltransferase involved in cell wall biosynthesis